MSDCSPNGDQCHYPSVLPSADFSSEGEEFGDGVEEEIHIFSRSSHIKTLGLPLGDPESSSSTSVLDLELDSLSGSSNILEHSSSKEDSEWKDEDGGSLSTNSWDKFKTEFSDKLREAEEVTTKDVGLKLSPPPPTTTRDDLFIEMITAFHDSRLTSDEPEEVISTSDLQIHGSNNNSSPNSNGGNILKLQTSPTKPRKSLLSLSTLEAIQESDLDWSLENVEKMESGQEWNEEDSDTFMDGNLISPFSPRSRTAWGADSGGGNGGVGKMKKDDTSLMEQLEELSKSQANGNVGFGELVISDTPMNPSSGQLQVVHPSRESRDTVFIDVRPQRSSNTTPSYGGSGKNAAVNHDDSSESDSDGDDLFAWAAQRRAIRDEQIRVLVSTTQSSVPQLDPGPTYSTTAATSSPSSSHDTPPHVSTHASLISPTTTSSSSTLSSSSSSILAQNHTSTSNRRLHTSTAQASHGTTISSTSSSSSAHNLHTVHRLPSSNTAPSSESRNNDTSITNSVNSSDNISTDHDGPQMSPPNALGDEDTNSKFKKAPAKKSSTRSRTRNSSSYSDGDVPSPETASYSGNSEDQHDANTKGPAAEKKSKSKKKGRKSKKTSKKESNQSSSSSGSQTKEKSQASQRRRAHILQRIRRDSWNTSSDEEHSLSSNSSDTLLAPGASDSVFTEHAQMDLTKEDQNVQRSAEEIKEELRKRILSKKPPAYFDTPATDPIYHDDVSFSDHVVDVILSASTGMLVVTVTCHGLVALPSPWMDKVSVEGQATLLCLLLTWLVTQIAQGQEEKNSKASPEDVRDHGRSNSTSDVPFEVTGIQYTLLDGNPSILVAIRDRAASADNRGISSSVDKYITMVTLGKVLEQFILQESSNVIDITPLWSILELPLSTFFTFQEDVSPLSTPVSFYWYSSYHQSCLPSSESLASRHKPSTTVFTLHGSSFRNPAFILSVFWRTVSSGLSIVGIRTIYGKQEDSLLQVVTPLNDHTPAENSVLLSVALRGPDAIQSWMEIVGPQDRKLARITDPSSLTALFGSDLIQTLRTPFRSSAALAKWFGGRACLKTCSVYGMSDSHTKSERRKRQRVRFSETQSESEDGFAASPMVDLVFPPLISNRPRLLVPAYAKSILVVSPGIPLSCYACILACCSKLGFDILGAKRVRLNTKRASILNIPGEYLVHFTPSSTPPSPMITLDSSSHPLTSGVVSVKQLLAPLPSSIFIVGRENGRVHSYALQHLITSSLKSLAATNPHVELPSSSLESPSLVHVTSYTEEKLKHFGSFSASISLANNISETSVGKDANSDELREELCFVAVPGSRSLGSCANFLDRVFHVNPPSELDYQGNLRSKSESDGSMNLEEPELVGMKIIPQLPRYHCKKLCPFPTSDHHYAQAIQLLTDTPTSLLVFRGVACCKKIQMYIKTLQGGSSHITSLEEQLSYIVSRTASEGSLFSSLFFSGKELFNDPGNWSMAPYYPHAWVHDPDILQGFQVPRENLFSVVWLPLGQMSLLLKVLDKLSRSGFMFAGVLSVEVGREEEKKEGVSVTQEANDARLVVCVERCNAIWATQHVVKPFTKDRAVENLTWSCNFDAAISDIKRSFPNGIWSEESNTVMEDYAIPQLTQDTFSSFVLSDACLKGVRSSSVLSYVSPLNERTAILLLPPLLTSSGVGGGGGAVGFVHVMEVLHKAHFNVCGVKMLLLSRDSAREVKIMCSSDIKVEDICSGPSLALVLERDNAASCFQLILKSTLNSYSHGDHLNMLFTNTVIPADIKQAKQLLELLQCS